MKTSIVRVILLCLGISAVAVSCQKQEPLVPECDGGSPTYDTEIDVIISANCMGSHCHESGSNRGDFTNYSGLSPFLNDGSFKEQVLTSQKMPQGNGKTLTQDEINTIQCWVENGYPEN